jgi:dUTP pyrophosphatase
MTKLQIMWMYILRYTWYLPVNIKNKLKKTPEKQVVNIKSKYIPERKTEGSAGYDLIADIQESFCVVLNNETKLIPTGVHIEIPKGKCGLLFLRSSVSINSPLILANGVGLIDSDYRGEIQIPLKNVSSRRAVINRGERLAQLVIVDCFTPELNRVKFLEETKRGDGGFGSTGVK